MFYNFVQFLKDEYPTERIYANGRFKLSTESIIPDRNVLVNEAGGTEQPWILYDRISLQLICRDRGNPQARALAYNIFENITSRFGLELPAVTVNGITYPLLQVAQITADQPPYFLGVDSEGRNEYVNNYTIIYRRE